MEWRFIEVESQGSSASHAAALNKLIILDCQPDRLSGRVIDFYRNEAGLSTLKKMENDSRHLKLHLKNQKYVKKVKKIYSAIH